MKLRNAVTGMVVLTLVFLAGCGGEGGGGGKGDPFAVAEQFMNLYYKQGNFQEAKALGNTEMAEKIQAAGAAAGEVAGEQEVSYLLKEKTHEGKHSYVLYQMSIKKKEGDPVYKTVALFVDLIDGAWKVTLFDEKIEPGPHLETTKS